MRFPKATLVSEVERLRELKKWNTIVCSKEKKIMIVHHTDSKRMCSECGCFRRECDMAEFELNDDCITMESRICLSCLVSAVVLINERSLDEDWVEP